jgi:hypothetical protein
MALPVISELGLNLNLNLKSGISKISSGWLHLLFAIATSAMPLILFYISTA